MTFGASSQSLYRTNRGETCPVCPKGKGIDSRLDNLRIIDLINAELKQGMRAICGKGFNLGELNSEKWAAIWPTIIGPQFFPDSAISVNRQAEIIRTLLPKVKKFLRKKNSSLIRQGIKWASMGAESRKRFLEEEAWHMTNTTNSKAGYRLGIGLKTRGCQYWRNHKLKMGCLNCGYFAAIPIGVAASSQQLVKQFRHALESVGKGHSIDYDVIDILNDGSFFNDGELNAGTREKIFEIISKKPNVKRVLVETRPEFVENKEKVCRLLKILRKDQDLEIAVGLETIDSFIINFGIRKGYGKGDFINLLKRLNGLKRCKVLAYCLVKPAFMADKQAIKDAVRTVSFLHKLSKETGTEISPKLEPAVVAEGTLLEVLNNEDEEASSYYSPPSYWTIAEIIATLADKKLEEKVRVGAREDMDLFKAVSCIEYGIGMLSRIDFLVYMAVQQFNKHREITRFLADMEPAFSDISFKEWMKKNQIKKPVLIKLHKRHKKAIIGINAERKYCRAREFLEKVSCCLDEIEYGEKTQDLAREGRIIELNELINSIISERLEGTVIHIGHQELLESGLRLLRMNVVIYSKSLKATYSIWAGVPTSRRVELNEVDAALGTN